MCGRLHQRWSKTASKLPYFSSPCPPPDTSCCSSSSPLAGTCRRGQSLPVQLVGEPPRQGLILLGLLRRAWQNRGNKPGQHDRASSLSGSTNGSTNGGGGGGSPSIYPSLSLLSDRVMDIITGRAPPAGHHRSREGWHDGVRVGGGGGGTNLCRRACAPWSCTCLGPMQRRAPPLPPPWR